MAALMEQVVDSTRWRAGTQYALAAPDAHPNAQNPSGCPGLWQPVAPRTARTAHLNRIVAAEILPRLARVRHHAGQATDPSLTTGDDTAELVRLILTQEAIAASRFIDTLLARGVTPAALYLGVLTQAAQRLGELWEQDHCDFAQVTVSTGRLQQVLRSLSPVFQMQGARRAQTDTVMLAPAPGEQHSFGLIMLAEFFAREGWHVAGGPSTSATKAAEMVRGTWIDVAGFSIGSAGRLDALAQCICSIRRASRNPNLSVMVGGPLLLVDPGLVTRVGADAAATDAVGAVRLARSLIATRLAAD